MNISRRHRLLLGGSIAIAMFSGSVTAQDLGQLKGIMGGSNIGGAASSLGSLSSISAGSTGNAAGVIEYCVKNNYLDGENASSASSVKDQLMGKLSDSEGQPAQDNPDYISGASGILTGSGGQGVDLSTAGLKAKAVKKVCNKILDQAKSML
jgi:hypothetical protein